MIVLFGYLKETEAQILSWHCERRRSILAAFKSYTTTCKCRALLRVCRALSRVSRARLRVCRALLMSCRALLMSYRALFVYVHSLVNISQKILWLIVQYKYSKSCSEDFILQNLILRKRLCGTGFMTQPSWLFYFNPTKMVGWKCLAPLRYQLPRGS